MARRHLRRWTAETEALEATVRPTTTRPRLRRCLRFVGSTSPTQIGTIFEICPIPPVNMEEVFDVNFVDLAQLGDSATRNEGSAFDPICESLRLGGVPLVENPAAEAGASMSLPEAQRDDQGNSRLSSLLIGDDAE